MIPKKAIQTIIFCIAQALVIFGIAIYFQGEHLKMVLPMATAILFSGISVFISLTFKGRKSDRECDERESIIREKAMKFCFYFMSFVLLAFWSYDVSFNGTFITASTLLLYLFLGSFFLAYAINKLRY